MKPVRIFRHITCEGPGYLADFLTQHDVPHELVAIDAGESVPEQLDDVSGLVFMGGPMSVNDDLDWIKAELKLIARAFERNIPMLGHCLGGQLISKALGGVVGPNQHKEIGWLPVDKMASNEWTENVPARFVCYHWHGETFTLPEGADLLLSSAHCPHQAFSLGNTLAFQCHLEMTAPMVREWAELYSDEIERDKPSFPDTIQDLAQQSESLDERVAEAQAAAGAFYGEWIKRLG
ncbi:MAG: type 1 glutamine amidotransferase [Gammaproteobacteria bacterium]